MLWLAGLMGLMAAGAVVYVDVPQEPDEDPADTLPANPDSLVDDVPLDDILTGTVDADTLQGGAGDDQISGYAGDDSIDAGAGDDVAHGAEGADTVAGGDGNDSVHGEDGDDTLLGDAGNDSLWGHNDDDVLQGLEGDDSLQGSAGDDTLSGGDGDDALMGGLDDDSLSGGAGQDTLFGGWGADFLSGLVLDENANGLSDRDETDFLNGGGGDDVIVAGQSDIVHSGDGADQIILGDWITGGDAAQITDYSKTDDTLLFVWDDSAGSNAPSDIAVAADPNAPGQFQVQLGDTLVAIVTGVDALTAEDVALVPLSSAQAAGLIPS